MLDTDKIALEGTFNRFIFEAQDSDYFIASIILKQNSMDSLKQYIVEKTGTIKSDGLSNRNDIPLMGNSTYFRTEMTDKISEYVFEVSVAYDEKFQRYNLKLLNFIEKMPVTTDALAHFLAKKIKYIGKVTAKKIIEHFGIENVEHIFNNDIQRLKEIPRIKESQIEAIKLQWDQYRMVFQVMNYLKEYEINDTVALKIFSKYGSKSIDIINKHPYDLCQIEGLSFKTVDKIALANGLPKEDKKRILYAILHVMEEMMYGTGDTIISKSKIIKNVHTLINVREKLIVEYVDLLIKSKKIINSKGKDGVSLSKIYQLETKIFNLIIEILNPQNKRQLFNEFVLKDFEVKNHFGLDEYQMASTMSIARHKISALIGGAGTGKTTTLKSILSLYEAQGHKVVLLAPTGKAAQRITLSTGKSAETIHRFLQILPEHLEAHLIDKSLVKDEFVDADLIVVDEASMLDVHVAYQLLKKADPQRTVLLFVGDTGQLPPVGVGDFFRDLLSFDAVNVCHLKKLHRQAENSMIAVNASNIREGQSISLAKADDFQFLSVDGEENIMNKIKEIYQELLDSGISSNDIQILSPTREKSLGCKIFNEDIRPIANSNFYEGVKDYCVGDKVIQTVNNYDLMVYNGDTGIVVEVEPHGEFLVVELGDPQYKTERIKYERKFFRELELAYAITIHKSQGSDYQYIIIPFTKKHYYQWNQKLLYTAITRAKKKVFLVGAREVLMSYSHNMKNEERMTNLQYMFQLFDSSLLSEQLEECPFE